MTCLHFSTPSSPWCFPCLGCTPSFPPYLCLTVTTLTPPLPTSSDFSPTHRVPHQTTTLYNISSRRTLTTQIVLSSESITWKVPSMNVYLLIPEKSVKDFWILSPPWIPRSLYSAEVRVKLKTLRQKLTWETNSKQPNVYQICPLDLFTNRQYETSL